MLMLEDDLFIGKGLHKAAFIYPGQPDKVVKVPFDPRDAELRHELAYRRSRHWRHLGSELLAGYYGPVETNKGRGYVFERVVNADGTACETMAERLQRLEKQAVCLKEQGSETLQSLREETAGWLRAFTEQMQSERILTNDTACQDNWVWQESGQEGRWRVIDNIGSPVAIPLVYYWDFMTRRHIERWRRRFRYSLLSQYPCLLNAESADI